MGMKNSLQMSLFVLLLIFSIAGLIFSSPIFKPFFILLLLYILFGIRIIYEYENGVLFTLGKYQGLLGSGLIWIAPIIQTLRKVDLRIRTLDLPTQEVITKDNISVKINATVFFRVQDPQNAILNVENYVYATLMYTQTVLRDVIGGVELDELLEKRDIIAEEIRKIVDEITDKWGIDITGVRLQDIEIPDEMRRAMARQAEAEREKRAVIIKSEGEIKAAENLVKAAEMISSAPASLHLRTLHTLSDISSDPNQKTIVLLPIELLKAFAKEEKKK